MCFLVYSDTKVTQNGAGLNLQGGVNVVQLQVRCDGQQGECVRRALQKDNARASPASFQFTNIAIKIFLYMSYATSLISHSSQLISIELSCLPS